MRFLEALGIKDPKASIDWWITPIDTYGLFECRGDMHRVQSSRERYYYFFIDNWQKPAALCLMERGIRYARIVARIRAPRLLIEASIAEQGASVRYQSLSINAGLASWLQQEVVDPVDLSLVTITCPEKNQRAESGLVLFSGNLQEEGVRLRAEPCFLQEKEIAALVKRYNMFESRLNPQGGFQSALFDSGDEKTVIDAATGIMWMRGGGDLGFFRRQQKWQAEVNASRLAGYSDWRLPSLEEALSLLRKEKNDAGLHVHECFTADQGYIYTCDRHRPGGYWFVDYGRGCSFWAGGTFNGGFRQGVPDDYARRIS
jgi:hypothetical protein